MDINSSLLALGALAQRTRLEAFRVLVRHEPTGLAAGALAEQLDIPQNTLSTHLTILAHAGLVSSVRQGRSIVYRADIAALRGLIVYLAKDCCSGRQELCAPLIEELACH